MKRVMVTLWLNTVGKQLSRAPCAQVQGASILQSLHGQRETIQRSQQKLHEADENISSSQKILRRMGRWLPF